MCLHVLIYKSRIFFLSELKSSDLMLEKNILVQNLNLLIANGSEHQISCPSIQEQNDCVERKHNHIIETGSTLLTNAQMPPSY